MWGCQNVEYLNIYIFIFSNKPRVFSQDFFILYYDISAKSKYPKMPNRPYMTIITKLCNIAKTIISKGRLTEIKKKKTITVKKIEQIEHKNTMILLV